ncbi:uncharacterized protein LOC125230057 isoform X2 [Leguminivora glycinivorella]|uniref:uncharacterized protein LOC125230057 isoform X2 n=1 Tax=Leguminivora glycinivorella TaxID=1035111 RepID=UPI00200D5B50|nr:uncharacterized protein LOC125230057 isoform X2 [Leguminivora glycinivorella]
MESTTLDAKEMCIKLEPYNDICGKKTAETIEDVCITAEHRQGMQVKTETNDSVSVKEEHHKQNLKMELSCSKVRDENSKDASGLYADHIVKDEHVLGPEIMERPMQGNTQKRNKVRSPIIIMNVSIVVSKQPESPL